MALIIDVETTGFPDSRNLPRDAHPCIENTQMYDGARIVQISMMLCNERFETVEMTDFVVRSEGFAIPNAHIHGITDAIAAESGVSFVDVVVPCLSRLLAHASHIVAHNARFDMSVLRSELFRRGLQPVLAAVDEKKVFCTMDGTRTLVNARTKRGHVKNPKLSELYMFACGESMENAHNSKYDVINLHRAIASLFNDNNRLCFPDPLVYSCMDFTSLPAVDPSTFVDVERACARDPQNLQSQGVYHL